MEYKNIYFKVVDFSNAKQAIEVQRKIFPTEDGLLNILASLDRNLFIKVTGVDYPDDNVKYYLAYFQNKVVGITGFYFDSDYKEEIWLAWFGVLQEYRGNGYAATILEWTINKAIAFNKKVLRLYTDAIENANAINLYKKMGFKGEKYMAEELSYDCYIYSKNLIDGMDILWNNRNLGLTYQTRLEELDEEKKNKIYKIYKRNYLKNLV